MPGGGSAGGGGCRCRHRWGGGCYAGLVGKPTRLPGMTQMQSCFCWSAVVQLRRRNLRGAPRRQPRVGTPAAKVRHAPTVLLAALLLATGQWENMWPPSDFWLQTLVSPGVHSHSYVNGNGASNTHNQAPPTTATSPLSSFTRVLPSPCPASSSSLPSSLPLPPSSPSLPLPAPQSFLPALSVAASAPPSSRRR